jgi:hypothetical protein
MKRGIIFAAFSVLTIIITCLGLLGLTAFTTQQKQKEISIIYSACIHYCLYVSRTGDDSTMAAMSEAAKSLRSE